MCQPAELLERRQGLLILASKASQLVIDLLFSSFLPGIGSRLDLSVSSMGLALLVLYFPV